MILTYLANYYCGATTDMKLLWREARDYEVHTHKLAERILTQMLFSEELFQEARFLSSTMRKEHISGSRKRILPMFPESMWWKSARSAGV